ncbi:MAG: SulP family inorganic anion transporter [Rickettsiales bacterium]
MTNAAPASLFSEWKRDVPAALVVFLVALPLCLGIAMASGAPLMSGLVAGVVGGIVVGSLSKSSLSVAGPAAGLTVIVLEALNVLPGYDAFLLAVFFAGLMQIAFGAMRAGVIGDYIPTSVINGMLAAIGIILILKQLPHALGYDDDYVSDAFFDGMKEENLRGALTKIFLEHVTYGATLLSLVSLAFLFWWDKKQKNSSGFLKYVPGPLIVVALGIAVAEAIALLAPEFAFPKEGMVSVPEITSWNELQNVFAFPNFTHISNGEVWKVAVTLALVASVETLLSIEAVDSIDPQRRITPCNRELLAQGVGNACSGLIGGLPVTSVIVRSSANVASGARTKLSAVLHGIFLLASIAFLPWLLNGIPLASLAAVLLSVGYKLASPAVFMKKYKDGLRRFVPFVATIAAILMTDLLVGVGIGVGVCVLLLIIDNVRSAVSLVKDSDAHYLVRLKKDVFFTHKPQLKQALAKISDGSAVLLDISRIDFVDRDNADVINRFIEDAERRNIKISVKTNNDKRINAFFKVGRHAAA